MPRLWVAPLAIRSKRCSPSSASPGGNSPTAARRSSLMRLFRASWSSGPCMVCLLLVSGSLLVAGVRRPRAPLVRGDQLARLVQLGQRQVEQLQAFLDFPQLAAQALAPEAAHLLLADQCSLDCVAH